MENIHISKDEALDTINAIRSDIKEDKKSSKKKKGFQGHLVSYLFVIPMLWVINIYTFSVVAEQGGNPIWWAIFPTIGWGIGLFFHFIRTR